MVILSTHIVEDVRDLCTQMAVIDRGEILLAGSPTALTRDIEGQVWRKPVARSEVSAARKKYEVIDERLFAGEIVLRVYSPERPDPSFQQDSCHHRGCLFPPRRPWLITRGSFAALYLTNVVACLACRAARRTQASGSLSLRGGLLLSRVSNNCNHKPNCEWADPNRTTLA